MLRLTIFLAASHQFLKVAGMPRQAEGRPRKRGRDVSQLDLACVVKRSRKGDKGLPVAWGKDVFHKYPKLAAKYHSIS